MNEHEYVETAQTSKSGLCKRNSSALAVNYEKEDYHETTFTFRNFVIVGDGAFDRLFRWRRECRY